MRRVTKRYEGQIHGGRWITAFHGVKWTACMMHRRVFGASQTYRNVNTLSQIRTEPAVDFASEIGVENEMLHVVESE